MSVSVVVTVNGVQYSGTLIEVAPNSPPPVPLPDTFTDGFRENF